MQRDCRMKKSGEPHSTFLSGVSSADAGPFSVSSATTSGQSAPTKKRPKTPPYSTLIIETVAAAAPRITPVPSHTAATYVSESGR